MFYEKLLFQNDTIFLKKNKELKRKPLNFFPPPVNDDAYFIQNYSIWSDWENCRHTAQRKKEDSDIEKNIYFLNFASFILLFLNGNDVKENINFVYFKRKKYKNEIFHEKDYD